MIKVYYSPFHNGAEVLATVGTEEEAQRLAAILPDNIYFFVEEN